MPVDLSSTFPILRLSEGGKAATLNGPLRQRGTAMASLPPALMSIVGAFAPLFSRPVWRRVQVLLVGAILTPGTRTVASVLRVMGLQSGARLQELSPGAEPGAVVVVGGQSGVAGLPGGDLRPLRRCGDGAGRYAGAAPRGEDRCQGHLPRSGALQPRHLRQGPGSALAESDAAIVHPLGTAGLGTAGADAAVPFATLLRHPWPGASAAHRAGPSQVLRQIKRWLPQREVVIVADSSFAVLEFLAGLPPGVQVVTRLRLDAALHAPAPARPPGQTGRPRKKGQRLPTLAQVVADPTTAWTTLTVPLWYGQKQRSCAGSRSTKDRLGWFSRSAAVLLCRAPVGAVCNVVQNVETQRQWSRQAIARTTPVLLGLFSLVTLLAHALQRQPCPPVRTSAWYHKAQPTFSDALAWVRAALWRGQSFPTSAFGTDIVKIPRPVLCRVMGKVELREV